MIRKSKLKQIVSFGLVLCMSVLIFHTSGSSTTSFANHDGIVYGDLDGDREIHCEDLILMERYILNIIDTFPNPYGLAAGELNGDGTIDSTDYALLKRFMMGLIHEFPIENQ